VNVAFLGTPDVAVPYLDGLVASGHDVRLVVTRQDRPSGRSAEPKPPPVKVRALEHGLTVAQPRTARGSGLAERLRGLDLDVLVVVAYGRILPRAVLDAARLGAVNVHFSLLPRYRGAAPVQWALARGETVTGVTIMRLDEGLDTGDMLVRRELAIEPGEHAPSLQRRLVALGVGLLEEALAGLASGTLVGRPQDHARATLAPILTPADGCVPPEANATEVEGRVRGFDPWPGVWWARAGRRIRILDARALDVVEAAAPPGTVLGLVADGVRIACGSGSVLEVTRLQPEGRRAMSARDAINGRQIAIGDRLEQVR